MRRFYIGVLWSLLVFFQVNAQSRKEIQIPDIPGFHTLKCDFHIHTVFSDGNVWPTIRVNEAWTQGLDAIAITDHIEYRPHSKDITADHNRSYEIAKPYADKAGLILIRGTEITRKMPPGHLNAIFITDANLIEKDDWFDACKEAKGQGAFVFWNHPGWKAQQPEKTLWWDEHTRLLEAGILGGIEAYNSKEYYPEALLWAQEKHLTLLANSDVHDPIETSYDLATTHRPVTLVFATEHTPEALKMALVNQQTAIYYEDRLVGETKFLAPIFYASIQVLNNPLRIENKVTKYIQLHNNSDVDYDLSRINSVDGFSYQKHVVLKAHQTTLIEIKGTSAEIKDRAKLKLIYEVTNLTVAPAENLKVEIEVSNL